MKICFESCTLQSYMPVHNHVIDGRSSMKSAAEIVDFLSIVKRPSFLCLFETFSSSDLVSKSQSESLHVMNKPRLWFCLLATLVCGYSCFSVTINQVQIHEDPCNYRIVPNFHDAIFLCTSRLTSRS